MTRNVHTCRESDSVATAAQRMRECNVGMLPIVDSGGRVRGLVTDRDLAVRVLGHNRTGAVPVSAVMTRAGLVTGLPNDRLRVAEDRMVAAEVGRAIVIDSKGRLVGVISLRDIARAEGRERTGEIVNAITKSHRPTAPVTA
jgi:CBS domain-containing protein